MKSFAIEMESILNRYTTQIEKAIQARASNEELIALSLAQNTEIKALLEKYNLKKEV